MQGAQSTKETQAIAFQCKLTLLPRWRAGRKLPGFGSTRELICFPRDLAGETWTLSVLNVLSYTPRISVPYFMRQATFSSSFPYLPVWLARGATIEKIYPEIYEVSESRELIEIRGISRSASAELAE